ncbi:TRAP transporter substrate-binding protein [Oceanobacillus salinisoli]|uniref:TRAP transporter substrate-binding protein n=1 Tax=Oceanobacillus salinisoli TaxID=2678611 RepID=UPI0018CC1766|nr:TRAP transporter substrate-binding protein DctP [Oceanobacillus salinisoli]
MKGKIRYLNLIVFVSLLLLLTACTSSTSSEAESSSDSRIDGNSEYKFTFNISYPPAADGSVLMRSTEEFAQRIEERTDGRVEIDLFFSNQLVPQDQLMDALKNDTVDLGYSGPQYYGDTIPTSFFTNIPFLAKDIDHLMSLIREKGIHEIYQRELEENGVKLLTYGPAGEYGLLSKKPIHSVEDMNGLNLRAAGGLWTPWYEEVGASPVNVAAAETYEALQRGTVDAIPYPYYSLRDFNLHEVVDYITVPGVTPAAIMAGYISLDTWNELPEDIQEIITEVSAEIEQESIEEYKRDREVTLEFAEEKGVEVIEWTDEEYEKFVESSQIVWDNFADLNENTSEIMDIIRENQ